MRQQRQPDSTSSSLPNATTSSRDDDNGRPELARDSPRLGGAVAAAATPPPSPSSSASASPSPSSSSSPVAAQRQSVPSRWAGGETSAPRRLSSSAMDESGGGLAGFLPESVVEAVAVEAAAAAARSSGAMAASRTLACVFQVCSAWRSISRSEFLWEKAFHLVWPSQSRRRRSAASSSSWRQEFQRAHATASNFHSGRARHTTLVTHDPGGRRSEPPRSLAISADFLAAGYFDGTLRVFSLATAACIQTLPTGEEEAFGPMSRAIAGISLRGDAIVFASLDGNVSTANARHGGRARAHVGRAIEDGALISFAASDRWWIGLYAGSPGRSFRVWDAETRAVVFTGGGMMDDDAMRGWNMFVERAGRVGRVRIGVVNEQEELLVAANQRRLAVFDLAAQGLPLVAEMAEASNAVEAVDVEGDKVMSASYDGVAGIRELPGLAAVAELRHAGVAGREEDRLQLFGALNSRQLLLCFSGAVTAWDVSSGERLYSLPEATGYMYNDMVASDSCVVVSSRDTGLHLWDFSPAAAAAGDHGD